MIPCLLAVEGLPGGLRADDRRQVPADIKAMLRKAQRWSCICTEDHSDIIDVLHSCALCVPREFLLPDSKTSMYMKTTQGIWIYFHLEDDGERSKKSSSFCRLAQVRVFLRRTLVQERHQWCLTHAAPFMDTSTCVCPPPPAPKADLWWSELFQTETQGIDIA